MSAFNLMQPFDAPSQKQLLIDRLMQQYQESANRAQGLQRSPAASSPSFAPLQPHPLFGGASPNQPMPLPVTTPRQVRLPQAHPFLPVRIGGV